MRLITEDNVQEIVNDRDKYTIVRFDDGSRSTIPRRFLIENWQDQESNVGTLEMGRACYIGVGSTVKVDNDGQVLRLGRFVAGGERIRFILNAQHPLTSMSTFLFWSMGREEFKQGKVGHYGPTVLKNDIWIGDEAMFLGGCLIDNGCVIAARALIPPEFITEPYGIYAGNPARLIRFRFSERIRELLLDLAWWEQPISWIKQYTDYFADDLAADEGRAVERLTELRRLVAVKQP